jgi:putative DNA methylase
MTEPRRKLIEVALPVEAISVACRRDKDRKVGTIKNVHKWFAPMPSPAWRALLFAALVNDPEDADRRAELLRIVERLVPSDGAPPPANAVAEARRVMEANGPLPVVLDPFCGGGSTIIEAQRLGLQTVASDLNPVPVLITRTLTELIPKIADRSAMHPGEHLKGVSGGRLEGFTTDVRHYAQRVRDDAWKEIGHLYAPVDGETVIAWLWARTVTCHNPTCRATIPLYSSPWLSKRKGQERWLQAIISGSNVSFDIGQGLGPPPSATKASPRGAKFRCPSCTEISPESHVKSEGVAQRLGLTLLALVVDDGTPGRRFLPASAEHARAMAITPPTDAPDIDLPDYARWFSSPAFGMGTQADLYTPRQLHMLGAFADAVAEIPRLVREDGGDEDYARAIASVLGLCVGKMAQYNSAQVRWKLDSRNGSGKAEAAFSRHALPMVWDFAEANPVGGSVGDWLQQVDSLSEGLRNLPVPRRPAVVRQSDARVAGASVSPGTALVATDPPYFSQIGYADLSDYFYVWERRALREVHADLFGTIATPKDTELIATPYRHGGSAEAARQYFVDGFTATFKSLAPASKPDLPMVVIYAHRQEEGEEAGGLTSTAWDAILGSLLNAGFGIVGTWPIHGTGSSRQIGLGTNALASYIAMVCRPRSATAGITDRLVLPP